MYISRSIFTAVLLASNTNAKENLRQHQKQTSRATEEDCAARENGLELFPEFDKAEQQVKVESVIDTDSCTYDVTLSWKPDTSIPFVDSPRGGIGRPAKVDVPYEFHSVCDDDGYSNEAMPVDAPDRVLTTENHTGTKEYYTERSYTVYTSDEVAEVTGIKDVVLGTAPCGQGVMKFPHNNVHFYHTSAKDERQEYRCVTGGGFFCKPYEEQCSDRARKMNMGGSDPRVMGDVYCNPSDPQPFTNAKNLPAGYTWTIDLPQFGQTNAAAGSQGLHGINANEFLGQYESIPKHLILQYDGELIANHVIVSAGFAKGLSDKTEYVKEFDWSTGFCVDDDVRQLATQMTTKYDPETGRTSVTAHGPLKDCSGKSFTDVIDYSTPAEELSSKSSKSGSKKGKAAKAVRPSTMEPAEPASTCGHQKVTFCEAPDFINNQFFREGGPRPDPTTGAPLADSLDYNVYQDPFFKFEDITEENHLAFTSFGPNGGMRVAKLGERAGQHRGVDFNIRDQTGVGGSAIGGLGPNLAMADILIDHPDHGTGTIKVNGYHTVFGEGELAIVGGTGDFAGAVGTVRPYYGLIYMDDETLDATGLSVNPGLALANSIVDQTPLSFGFYLDMDFICRGP